MDSALSNPYSVYIIYDNDNRNQDVFIDLLKSTTDDPDDIIYINNVRTKNDTSVKKYICCMKKNLNDTISAKGCFAEEHNINIKRYNSTHDNLPEGTTYGYHVQLDDNISFEQVESFFNFFEEKGMIYKNSIKFFKMPDYPDGTSRNYLIVKFEKIDGKISKQFIKKFRALINNSTFSDSLLKVNWVQHSVLKDIEEGNNKNKNKNIKK